MFIHSNMIELVLLILIRKIVLQKTVYKKSPQSGTAKPSLGHLETLQP